MSFSQGAKGTTDISDSNIISDFSNFNLNDLQGVIGGRIHIYIAAEKIHKFRVVELIANSNGTLAIQEARGLNTINPICGVSIQEVVAGEKCQVAVSGITRVHLSYKNKKISKYNYLQLDPEASIYNYGGVFDTEMNFINITKPFADANSTQNADFGIANYIYLAIKRGVGRDAIVDSVNAYLNELKLADPSTNLSLSDSTILSVYDNLLLLMNTYPNQRDNFRWLYSQSGYTSYELAGRKGYMPDQFLAVALEHIPANTRDTVLCYLTK